MNAYEQVQAQLREEPRTWLVTGAAGFIGSSLSEALLKLGQRVVGLDNFATGHARNLGDVARAVGEEAWARFSFLEGDVRRLDDVREAVRGVDAALHHAAFVSVPGSLKDPALNNAVNVEGFLNLLLAAKDANVKRVVYASSSAVYGDSAALPAAEADIGRSLSPYATSKFVNELYADLFARSYGVRSVGLRYFNIFGPRQDPGGAYAAVISKWADRLLAGERCVIYGDGSATRDFCFVANVVQANLLAAVGEDAATNEGHAVYNIGNGARTTTAELYAALRDALADVTGGNELRALEPLFEPPRAGDVKDSQADIGKAERELGYLPLVSLDEGLRRTLEWYARAASAGLIQPKMSVR